MSQLHGTQTASKRQRPPAENPPRLSIAQDASTEFDSRGGIAPSEMATERQEHRGSGRFGFDDAGAVILEEGIVAASKAARSAQERVLAAGKELRGKAAQAGGLLPAESSVLDATDRNAEGSVLHFLQQLDAAKQELDMRRENALFAESTTGILNRTAEAQARKRGAAEMLKKAQEAYAALLKPSAQDGSAYKAVRIHNAREKFARLEAQLNGQELSLAEEAKYTGVAPAEMRNLSRHDQLRAEFVKAKEEYIAVRAEILGVHLNAFLHEQSALADARVIEVVRARRGNGLVGEVRGQKIGDMASFAIESGLAALYRAKEVLRDFSVAKLFGFDAAKGSTTVRQAIQGEMMGARTLSSNSGVEITIPSRSLNVADALRRPEMLTEVTSEQLRELQSNDLKRLHADMYARALANGKKLQDIAGYNTVQAEIARRNADRFGVAIDRVNAPEHTAAYYEEVRAALRTLVSSTNAAMRSAERNPRRASRVPAVAAAFAVFALGSTAPEGTFIPAAHAEPAPTTESAPIAIERNSLESLYQHREMSEATQARALYDLVISELGAKGDQVIDMQGVSVHVSESEGHVTAAVGPRSIDLGTVKEPWLPGYVTLSNIVKEKLGFGVGERAQISEEADTEIVPPTGLFMDDNMREHNNPAHVSFADRVRSADDALDRVLDVGGRAMGLPDDSAHNLLPDGQSQHFSGRASERVRKEKASDIMTDHAWEEATAWAEPTHLTESARIADRSQLELTHNLKLRDGGLVHFDDRTGITITGAFDKKKALNYVLDKNYRETISRLITENNQETVNPAQAIASVEHAAVRLANLLRVRDDMVARGLTDTVQFEQLLDEMNASEKAVQRYGHVINGDPQLGTRSASQAVDNVVTFDYLKDHFDVNKTTRPGEHK